MLTAFTFIHTMSLPKPISEIKTDLVELLQDAAAAKALQYLQDLLPEGSGKRNQAILIQGKLSNAMHQHLTGQLKFEDQQIELSRVNAAILEIANGLSAADFEVSGQKAVAASPKFMVIYAPEDEPHCTQLNRHLNILKMLKKIRVYNVQETQGVDLLAQAKIEMKDADYLLVLITVNLFNAPDWFELVFNALGEGRRMIPIRIEKADFEGTGLEKFKSLPSMGKAVSDFPNADSAYADIVGELKKLLPK